MPESTCTHIESIDEVRHPVRRECEECVKLGYKS